MNVAQATIAIVDDDTDILLSAQLFLKRYFEEIFTFEHPELLHENSKIEAIDIVLLDLNYKQGEFDGKEGLKALEKIKRQLPETEVIVMTAYAEVNIAVEAVKKGAFDFVVKPWQNEKLLVTIMNAVQKKQMGAQLLQQEAVIHANTDHMDPLIGESDALQQIRSLIHQVAPTSVNIFISGQSGSGKELIAKHLHRLSNCHEQAFISIDFSNIPKENQASSLFGSIDYSYGKWQQAKGGTLYLKEVSLMTLTVQNELLHRLKSEKDKPFRLISSSKKEVLEQNMNKELFYRLRTIEIPVPPLQERWDDLSDLTDYFFTQYKRLHQKPQLTLSEQTIHQLRQHSWPGNVRELKQVIERAVILLSNEIQAKDLIPLSSPSQESFKLEDMERKYILNALKQCNGNIQQSAQQLGISRAALYRRIDKYQLSI